jgi:hypothetical protein
MPARAPISEFSGDERAAKRKGDVESKKGWENKV